MKRRDFFRSLAAAPAALLFTGQKPVEGSDLQLVGVAGHDIHRGEPIYSATSVIVRRGLKGETHFSYGNPKVVEEIQRYCLDRL